ncbi:hypothetical protein SORBI_3005G119800 [Sorghum bicolor]|uniref:Uncharacterized protein n=1 Tax=Sorghum bicolor TaxID=4558 RepID=A0A1Z5RIN0_SORBI|nr:hypothetical protein SORBI_3005G119800 [Sorghum bicolor]
MSGRRCRSAYSRPRDTPAAEETETETEPSERQRRARGRPRLEPSADHDLGFSRSSRGDDVPPQMYDEVPPESEEGVPHTSEEGVWGSTSSAGSKTYKRGPSQLPKRPIPVDRRPLIAPEGDK